MDYLLKLNINDINISIWDIQDKSMIINKDNNSNLLKFKIRYWKFYPLLIFILNKLGDWSSSFLIELFLVFDLNMSG